jgi:hypothetical protein
MMISCKKEKDENGNYVTYYENKMVTGYVFSADSLLPIPNCLMHIEAAKYFGYGWSGSKEAHADYCYTDETGKFTFKFVKKINTHKVTDWEIGFGREIVTDYWTNSISIDICSSCPIKIEDIGENTILDTFYLHEPINK